MPSPCPLRAPGSVRLASLALLATALLTPRVLPAQVLSGELLFTAIQPCRIVDTRNAGGILAPGTTRAFDVAGVESPGSLAGQGGNSAGCPIPGFAGATPVVRAVAINLVAVGPSGPGHLVAWPTDQAEPIASVINYTAVAGLNIANGLILPVRQDSEGGDITIRAAVSSTHVVADAVGYFTSAAPRRFYLTTTTTTGGGADTQCEPGFHFASLWEIFDPTVLQYDTALGETDPDSGEGPGTGAPGWVRTGGLSFNVGAPGTANCATWTNSIATNVGTTVRLVSDWSPASVVISPWSAQTYTCNLTHRSWCVED